jgi:hypothetical protein
VQLVGGGALGAEAALVVRAPLVALNVHDLVADGVNDHGAADRAVRAYAGGSLGIPDPELLGPGRDRREAGAEAEERPERGSRAEAGSRDPEEFATRKLGHFVLSPIEVMGIYEEHYIIGLYSFAVVGEIGRALRPDCHRES